MPLKDSIFGDIDSIYIQRMDGTYEPLTFSDEITLEPIDTSKCDEEYTMPKGVETFSFSFDGKIDKKTQKRLKRLLSNAGKPFTIEWRTVPFFSRVRLWLIITWAKLRHYPILIENDNSTRAICFKDINDAF